MSNTTADGKNNAEWMPYRPTERFTRTAREIKLITAGEALDPIILELCGCIVEMAASIGDRYNISDDLPSTVGDRIREMLKK